MELFLIAVPVLYNYTYYHLNRLKAMNVYNGTNTGGANLWSGTFTATPKSKGSWHTKQKPLPHQKN